MRGLFCCRRRRASGFAAAVTVPFSTSLKLWILLLLRLRLILAQYKPDQDSPSGFHLIPLLFIPGFGHTDSVCNVHASNGVRETSQSHSFGHCMHILHFQRCSSFSPEPLLEEWKRPLSAAPHAGYHYEKCIQRRRAVGSNLHDLINRRCGGCGGAKASVWKSSRV